MSKTSKMRLLSSKEGRKVKVPHFVDSRFLIIRLPKFLTDIRIGKDIKAMLAVGM